MVRPSLGGMAGLRLGVIDIPFEGADLLRHPTWFHLLIIVVNVGIVLYMLMLRLETRDAARAHT